MPTDDEILERVQLRATAIRRRQRLMVTGAATVVVAALLGGAVMASAAREGRTPVDAAAQPTDRPDPATTTVPADAGGCDRAPSDRDLGPGSAGPGGSPPASTDGSGPELSSPSTASSVPLPAQGDPAGSPPAESSIPPDDPPAASATVVEAASTTCPLQVRVTAVRQPGSAQVDVIVTVTAEPGFDAQGFIAWDAGDPVDLGQVARNPGSCAAGEGEADAVAVQEQIGRSHVYPSAAPQEVTVTFWASRCEGPGHQVEVAVVVPL